MTTKEKKDFTKLLGSQSPEATEMRPLLLQFLIEIQDRNLSYWNLKLSEIRAYQTLKYKDVAYKGRLALATAEAMRQQTDDYQIRHQLEALLQMLLRSTLGLGSDGLLRLLGLYGLQEGQTELSAYTTAMYRFPLLLTLGQVDKLAKKESLSDELTARLHHLLALTANNTSDAGVAKMRVKVQEILGKSEGAADALPVVRFADGDFFGKQLNDVVEQLHDDNPAARPWLTLLQLWQKASGSQPSAKFRKELDAAVAAIGEPEVQARGNDLLGLLLRVAVEERQNVYSYGDGSTRTYTEYVWVLEPNLNVAKGLIWTMQAVANETTMHQLADLAVKCYRKIPGRGPLAASLGNACLLVLAESGLAGVAYLSRVRPKIKQSNTQSLIAGHIEKASEKLGVSPAEIEDMAAPDFGLQAGQVQHEFGEYTATLRLVAGKAEVQWEKVGKPLKLAPAALKSTHAEELKELKNAQAQAQQTFTAQRERLDRSFVEERRIPFAWFQQYYFEHGLMAELARPLIWRFHHAEGSFTDGLWLDGAWCDNQGSPLAPPSEADTVQLWHPVLTDSTQVLAWRSLLDARQLRQPLKQAYREVYLLTPPEERTRTYSNRMAAHVLKQHQFNSLAKLRGWHYSLMGAYDKGYESDSATLQLPAHDLRAEFWVSEVNANDAFNDTGIWNYISTDQVRFTRMNADEPLPLPEVPPLVFSEVMRDVDLFVGVASVGNDPLWRDNGGLVQYRNYWESYSFGELGEVAKNRKLALERLVPRLKIGKVSEIKGNFLEVKGKLRTYKIHLGSGNILMTPNDQYLCIVPDRSAKTASTAGVFLPFEGDAVLSIILSKALLLMDDDTITDDNIVRQIAR
jgi:hypothetical protein